ncbi:MAG: hypothetical protein PHN45_08805 [Methylococcales bacterium]|nr:hypothetical protein [Methylococcales bacterium]
MLQQFTSVIEKQTADTDRMKNRIRELEDERDRLKKTCDAAIISNRDAIEQLVSKVDILLSNTSLFESKAISVSQIKTNIPRVEVEEEFETALIRPESPGLEVRPTSTYEADEAKTQRLLEESKEQARVENAEPLQFPTMSPPPSPRSLEKELNEMDVPSISPSESPIIGSEMMVSMNEISPQAWQSVIDGTELSKLDSGESV